MTLCLSPQILTLEDQTSGQKNNNIFPREKCLFGQPGPSGADRWGQVAQCKVKVSLWLGGPFRIPEDRE